jgi:hypothetical protein
MGTASPSNSSVSGNGDNSDTTYPSVPNNGVLDDNSSNGTDASLQQEYLVVHKNRATSACNISTSALVPGFSSATAKNMQQVRV